MIALFPCYVGSFLTQNPRPDAQSQSDYDSLIKIPNGLFYSQKESKDNMGYLRIIPVDFENEVVDCDDYKSLVEVLSLQATHV